MNVCMKYKWKITHFKNFVLKITVVKNLFFIRYFFKKCTYELAK